MRITCKVTTAGDRGLMRMPRLPEAGDAFRGEGGVADEGKIRSVLKDIDGIRFDGDDDICILSFVVEFLDRVKLSYGQWSEKHPDELNVGNKGDEKVETTCDRRMKREKFVFVTVDISRAYGGLKVVLSHDNPKNVVGCAEELAEYVARTFADIIVALVDDVAKVQDNIRIKLIGENGCETLFQEARIREDMRKLIDQKRFCDRRQACYCSPPDMECVFYKDGKCTINDPVVQ